MRDRSVRDGIVRDLSFSRAWHNRAAWAALAAGSAFAMVFAIVYNPFDFNVYRWGGQAVTHAMRLYLVQVDAHWFTYTPFAAIVFVPLSAIPDVLGRVVWEMLSVLALVVAARISLRLAGYRASWPVVAAVAAVGMTLEPIYHSFFLGQINIILLALILIDVLRTARGQSAGIGLGVAAAIKLTPLIFIVLFLLTRRTKTALTAIGTFLTCGLIGYIVAPGDSGLYWHHLFNDTGRVGVPYISNQSPFAALVRIAGGSADVGHWYLVVPVVIGSIGLAIAVVLARYNDWLGAATVTGVTGLLVSPVSWTHHWVWILPALIILMQGGLRARVAAGCAYVLFVVAPMWFTPRSGGPSEYGFHWLATLVANCFLVAGVAFIGYMAWYAAELRRSQRPPAESMRVAEPAGTPARES